MIVLLLACRTLDADGDGWTTREDCDDANPSVHPGADELCDELDQDCDDIVDEDALDAVVWWADGDGDGYGGEASEPSCDAPAGHVDNNGDCDDGDDDVFPGAPELCNGLDDDCDGAVDEEALDTTDWYDDDDGDGFGAGEPQAGCEPASGQVASNTDCDDEDDSAYPGADDFPYDGIDQDCDGADLDDLDGDGSLYADDCDDTDPNRSPDLYEVCDDGIDNDCNDEVDTDCQYFGGVVSGDPAAVIYGEDTSIACCGSQAGAFLYGDTDFDQDGFNDLVMWSESGGTEYKLMTGPFSGTVDTSAAVAEFNRLGWEGFEDNGQNYYFAGGDLSGDGVPDLAIGDPGPAGDQLGGMTAIYFGPLEGWHGTQGYDVLLEGEQTDYAGAGLIVGEMSGDEDEDLVIGVPHAGYYEDFHGDVVVIEGPLAAGGSTVSCAEHTGLTEHGNRDLGYAQLALDLGSDGQPDLLALSANPKDEDSARESPRLFLAHGPLTTCIPTPDTDSVLILDDVNEFDAGNVHDPISLEASDANGDGIQDVLLAGQARDDESGGNYVSTGYMFHGPISSNSSAGDAALTLSADTYDYGRIVADFAGDLDEDGHVDLLVGMNEMHEDSESAGTAYVLFGPLSGSYVIEEDAFGVLEGAVEPFDFCETDGCEHPGSLFGWTVAGGNDLTGDGVLDVAIGAPGFEVDVTTNDKGPGAVYIYSGGSGG